MKLIVGLGNPGPAYSQTRHNVGFMVVDALADRWGTAFKTEKFHAFFSEAVVGEHRIVLLKPTTFMNRSGNAVLDAGRFYRMELTDLLVVSDDLALPLGKLRMRVSGSSGSHKGLQNIVDRLGSQDWCRLRVGIDAAWGQTAQYVLSRFEREEKEDVDRCVERAADAVESWVHWGPEPTMNRFNADPAEGS